AGGGRSGTRAWGRITVMAELSAEGEDRSRAHGEGASLGEAKWSALRVLELRFPGISADDVEFHVIDEGDQDSGRPTRVEASVDEAAAAEAAELPDDPAERVRALVTRVTGAMGLRASVDIQEDDEEIRATVNGDDLGLLIGKHGGTIDALQHLAVRAA